MAGTEQGQDRDKTGTRLGRGRAKEGKKGWGVCIGGRGGKGMVRDR